MKNLIVLFALVFCAASYGQRLITNDSLALNKGATDTMSFEVNIPNNIFFGGGVWSYQLDYSAFDDIDATLALYFSNFHPDSSAWTLMFFDYNLDGTNDNPFTLSDTTGGSLFAWGQVFPGRYFIRQLTRNNVSDSTAAYEKIVKQ